MPRKKHSQSQAGSVFQHVLFVEETTDHVQSSTLSLPQEQEIIVEKGFPLELLTVDIKSLHVFMSRFDGYTYDNCKRYITGNIIQEALAYYTPSILNVDETGIDYRGLISNKSYQLKVTKKIENNEIKGFKLKNKQGEGNSKIIYADYYVFLEQSTGRGACVHKSRIENVCQQSSDAVANVKFQSTDFWMPPYDIKSNLSPDGKIVMTDDFWTEFEQFKKEQYEKCKVLS